MRSPLVSQAVAYASTAHGSQVPHTTEMLAAALLHDTIEDTCVTRQDIEREFGPSVAKLVMELADQCHDGKPAERKSAEAARLAKVSREAQTFKHADVISNTRSIVHPREVGRFGATQMSAAFQSSSSPFACHGTIGNLCRETASEPFIRRS